MLVFVAKCLGVSWGPGEAPRKAFWEGLGLPWDRLGPTWDHFRIVLKLYWDHLAILLGSFGDHLGVTFSIIRNSVLELKLPSSLSSLLLVCGLALESLPDEKSI